MEIRPMNFSRRLISASLCVAFTLAVSVTIGCQKEAPAPPPPKSEPAPPPPFVAPADGKATLDQVKRYALARQSISEINGAYLDSLEGMGPDARPAVLKAMETAKDVTARKYGLNGFAEYQWLSESASENPENKPLFTEAGLLIP
jgi:hypothetical protein